MFRSDPFPQHQDGERPETPVAVPDLVMDTPEGLAEAIGLTRAIAWKFARTEARRIPVDEIFSEALFGLAYAKHLFDESRGVPFRKYAVMVICHRVRNLIKNWRRLDREVPIPRTKMDADIEWEPADLVDGQQVARDLDADDLWIRVRDMLPPRHFEIVKLHFRGGRSVAHIAEDMGISRQRAYQLLSKATRRLREHWGLFPPDV